MNKEKENQVCILDYMGFERGIVDLVEIEGVTEAENEQGVGEMCFFFPRVCV